MSVLEHHSTNLEVAVIGLACRVPGAKNSDEFWLNLINGVESITAFSDEELLAAGVDPELLRNPNYVKAGAVVADIDRFDAAFFGYRPSEAEIIDPQQRVFLECAWEALEHAGYNPERAGNVGVFAGVSSSTYLLNNLYANPQVVNSVGSFPIQIANDKDFLTTRVSYKLNLEGPSMVVQTACSTSLVAVHLACQSLLNGECSMALAGGAAIRVPHQVGYPYQEGGITSPDGHCRAFDASAQGTVSSSGVGIVVLKLLEDALNDRDHIYAVIKGSAINNDGALKVGFTAPRTDGQARVIKAAHAMAEVAPSTISYVEAHGTGTLLGDPIEVEALTKVFREETDQSGFCGIGSVKTNIGHLDTAAGVTGLIKTVLALKHGKLPPSLHFERPNPAIDFANSPFYVTAALKEWTTNGAPRRAGVSSFGIGGTNAHVVLEEAPPTPSLPVARPDQLLVVSARSPQALERATDNLVAHLTAHPDLNLADAAYTLQVGRTAFTHRRMLVCQDAASAVAALATRDPKSVFSGAAPADQPSVVFMFPGGGAHYLDMGREVYASEPVFRAHIDQCAEWLRPHLGRDLRAVLYPDDGHRDEAAVLLRGPAIGLPALFAVEYALARLWMAWGIQPEGLIGHSLGEYVAACLSGVLRPEDALAMVALRGRLFEQLPPGAMLSVALPEAELLPLLDDALSLAAVNASGQCVVSGLPGAIERLEAKLTERGVESRRLHIDVAAHSSMLEPILTPFEAFAATLSFGEPTIPYISNVTGDWITAAEATNPQYWARHLRQTVRFSDGLTVLGGERRIFLEVGPGRSLSGYARQSARRSGPPLTLTSLRHATDEQSDSAYLLNAAGRLWLAGAPIDWRTLHESQPRQRVPLPTYPFEHQRYWIDPLGAPPSSLGYAAALPETAGTEGGEYTTQTLHERPDVATSYVPPRTEIERQLTAIWQGLFGISEIGIHDQFAELGGDSLLVMQLKTRVRAVFEVDLSVRELYKHTTIAEMALLVEAAQDGADARLSVLADQGLVSGDLPLLPRQAKILGLNMRRPDHWNIIELMQVNQRLDCVLAKQTFDVVLSHHDALRSRFIRDGDGWRQQILSTESRSVFAYHDLSALPEEDRFPTVFAHIEELQGSLSLTEGPVMRVAYFDFGPATPGRLLMIFHHLVSDGVSLHVLIHDCETVYRQLLAGETPRLPAKTTSIKQWGEHLAAYAASEAIRDELAYWVSRLDRPVSPVPVDYPGSPNLEGSVAVVKAQLSPEETAALLHDAANTHRVQIYDLMVAALACAFAQWIGGEALILELMRHGREPLVDTVDLSRTVGLFVAEVPLALDLTQTDTPGHALAAIKTALDEMPHQGIGYGVLRYMGDAAVANQLQALPQPAVSFNYLGREDQSVHTGPALLEPAPEGSGSRVGADEQRRYLIQIQARVNPAGRLTTLWKYSQTQHERATIERVAQIYTETLRWFIDQSQNRMVGADDGVGH